MTSRSVHNKEVLKKQMELALKGQYSIVREESDSLRYYLVPCTKEEFIREEQATLRWKTEEAK
jgi:hypothetical protein